MKDISADFPEWAARRTLPIASLDAWGAEQWAKWWADGIRIWYSDYRSSDRREAFAPMLLDVDRDLPEERLPDLLARFYDPSAGEDAACALAAQTAIEGGMLRLLRDRHFMASSTVPLLALRVFSELPARSSGDMVHAILSAMGREWLEPDAEGELVPALAYSILNFVDPTELDDVKLHFESLLEQQPGPVAPLIYAIAISEGDIVTALATFGRLWTGEAVGAAQDVWSDVADELNRQFGRKRVARVVRDIISNGPALSPQRYDAMVPAIRLEHCYAAADHPIGLRALLERTEGRIARILSIGRGLSTDVPPCDPEAAMACG